MPTPKLVPRPNLDNADVQARTPSPSPEQHRELQGLSGPGTNLTHNLIGPVPKPRAVTRLPVGTSLLDRCGTFFT